MLNTLFKLRRTITFSIKTDRKKISASENIKVCKLIFRNYQISMKAKEKERDKLLDIIENKMHLQMLMADERIDCKLFS